MRVLIASHSAGLRGGAERCVLELASALRDDGRVEPIVTMPTRGELTKALESSDITTRLMPAPTWLVNPSAPWPHDPLRAARRLRRIAGATSAVRPWTKMLRAVAPDVVMSSTTVSPTAALASRRTHIPHVWWIHEFTTLDHDKRYALGEVQAQRFIERFSDAVAVNSKAVAEHYAPPVADSKIRTIEIAVEPGGVKPNSVECGELRVLLLGRKAPPKGSDIALRAIAEAAQHGADIKMRMVGPAEPGYAAELWYLARDLGALERVEFIEYESDPTSQFEWANVVFVPSRCEAFGRVTVESLKSGRPVVGSRSGGTAELLAHGCNGFLVDPGDVGGFAAALLRLANDAALVSEMSRHATASMAGRFTTRGEVDTFVDLFSEVRGR
jgi:glycosyltransferase involved in cell wall biosynthesis